MKTITINISRLNDFQSYCLNRMYRSEFGFNTELSEHNEDTISLEFERISASIDTIKSIIEDKTHDWYLTKGVYDASDFQY